MPDINVETILFMSIVKSLSVGNGDMFYIQHNSDNFTVIDCFLSDENKKTIMDEIISKSTDKNITRFISTHPDEDHIKGLVCLVIFFVAGGGSLRWLRWASIPKITEMQSANLYL